MVGICLMFIHRESVLVTRNKTLFLGSTPSISDIFNILLIKLIRNCRQQLLILKND